MNNFLMVALLRQRLARRVARWGDALRIQRVERLYPWLDRHVFTYLLAYAASPAHILLLLAIMLGLMLGSFWTAWEFIGGNYINGIGALGACILLYHQIGEAAKHRQRHAELLAKHEETAARVQELERHVRGAAGRGAKNAAPQVPAPPPRTQPLTRRLEQQRPAPQQQQQRPPLGTPYIASADTSAVAYPRAPTAQLAIAQVPAPPLSSRKRSRSRKSAPPTLPTPPGPGGAANDQRHSASRARPDRA